jgi:hypothetical protein
MASVHLALGFYDVGSASAFRCLRWMHSVSFNDHLQSSDGIVLFLVFFSSSSSTCYCFCNSREKTKADRSRNEGEQKEKGMELQNGTEKKSLISG